MLSVKNVTKSFSKNKQVLDELNVDFENGVYGLLGPNGSGKTTLMRCIMGLYPCSGEIKLNGEKIKNNPAVSSNIGYLPQSFGLFRDLSVFELMDYFAAQKSIPRDKVKAEIEKALENVNLSDKAKVKCRKLSGGMVRRVGIAQAILGSPEVIMLDEPTAGLDPEERLRFKNVVSSISKDVTVIISTHIVEDVESVCDKIVVFDKGNVIKNDSVQNVRSAANGKVFNVADADAVGADCFVIREYTSDDGEKLKRVLSAVSCGNSLQPTVEDGYLCLLKGI